MNDIVLPSRPGTKFNQSPNGDVLQIRGIFHVKCFNVDGSLAWEEDAPNTVVNQGKNLILDTILATSGTYTTVGPFVGLISSVGWSSTAATDTQLSHPNWTEAGVTNAPTYGATRPTAAWSAASGGSISLSSAASYTFTGSGTIEGCFIVFGTGAVASVDSTAGSLLSAGTFTGGAQAVSSSQSISVSYSLSL